MGNLPQEAPRLNRRGERGIEDSELTRSCEPFPWLGAGYLYTTSAPHEIVHLIAIVLVLGDVKTTKR